ncbi:uncharacterized protein LOC129742817, partial [Uranotaenia lowii]|uniref:uncharacterized protein LOC129742817 n=1 Tax=Uranotaenia lowii TaxID=190385 RepID=UPI002478A49F
NQLLLTLMKLRHDCDFMLLAVLFRIHRTTVSAVFKFWILLLHKTLSAIDFWSLRCAASHLYTVNIDCTEFIIEKPESPAEQQATWSSYKNNNTVKVLVGVDEEGMVIFVSDLFGGSATDDIILADSGLLGILKEGDHVLADRGFSCSDLLAEKGIILNKPPPKKGPQMAPENVALTRATASRRVNVERIIGLAKTNKVLKHKVGHCLLPLMNKIVQLSFWLVNIKKPICKVLARACKCPKSDPVVSTSSSNTNVVVNIQQPSTSFQAVTTIPQSVAQHKSSSVQTVSNMSTDIEELQSRAEAMEKLAEALVRWDIPETNQRVQILNCHSMSDEEMLGTFGKFKNELLHLFNQSKNLPNYAWKLVNYQDVANILTEDQAYKMIQHLEYTIVPYEERGNYTELLSSLVYEWATRIFQQKFGFSSLDEVVDRIKIQDVQRIFDNPSP